MFNYAKEKYLFDQKWEKIRKNYIKEGMNDYQINEMYEFDFNLFRKKRILANHTDTLTLTEFNTDEFSEDKITNRTLMSFGKEIDYEKECTRFYWLEEIENKNLYKYLKNLNLSDLELVDLYFIRKMKQVEISKYKNCSQSNISQKINKITQKTTSIIGTTNKD